VARVPKTASSSPQPRGRSLRVLSHCVTHRSTTCGSPYFRSRYCKLGDSTTANSA
jgi:hypothetical protein